MCYFSEKATPWAFGGDPKLRWTLANMASATPAGRTAPTDPRGAVADARSRAGLHRSENQPSPPAEPSTDMFGQRYSFSLSDLWVSQQVGSDSWQAQWMHNMCHFTHQAHHTSTSYSTSYRPHVLCHKPSRHFTQAYHAGTCACTKCLYDVWHDTCWFCDVDCMMLLSGAWCACLVYNVPAWCDYQTYHTYVLYVSYIISYIHIMQATCTQDVMLQLTCIKAWPSCDGHSAHRHDSRHKQWYLHRHNK